MKRLFLPMLLSALAAPAAAQAIRDCETFEANARNIYPPYEETIRDYANGAIRVIALDVGEPAAAAFHLLVTHPAGGDEPWAACTLVSSTESLGFSGLWMDRADATYDPAVGLVVSIPVQVFDGVDFQEMALSLTINQAAGTVSPVLRSEALAIEGGGSK